MSLVFAIKYKTIIIHCRTGFFVHDKHFRTQTLHDKSSQVSLKQY